MELGALVILKIIYGQKWTHLLVSLIFKKINADTKHMYKFTSLGGSKSQDTQESCRNSDKLSNIASPSIKKKK